MKEATWDLRKFDALKKRLEKLEKKEVRWGFFNTRYGAENDNLYVATVAKIQEDGDPSKNIPERKFFTTNVARIANFYDPISQRVWDGVNTAVAYTMLYNDANQSFKLIGEELKVALQQEILDWALPPNSAYTEKKKGFNDPLIDSGYMFDSVSYRIKGISDE